MGRAWTPPDSFDEYRLLRPLGHGGMGQVWVAHDTVLDRPVAVKFIGSELDQDPVARERFLVEARAAARLQHPNVVAIYRVGELERRPFLVSELIEGTPLSRIERPMGWARALDLGIGLARGLAAAHRRGVLHRDIKPANAIVADDGQVKLLDFGLAKLLERGVAASAIGASASATAIATVTATAIAARLADSPPTVATGTPPLREVRGARDAVTVDLGGDDAGDARDDRVVRGDRDADLARSDATRAGLAHTMPASPGPLVTDAPTENHQLTRRGAVMGTPYYMPPETWRGEPATRASDVYALGAVLYELCAGQPPHGDTASADLARVVPEVDAAPLTRAVPAVDPRFAALVDRCLARDAAQRPPTAEALLIALEGLRAEAAGRAAPEGNPYRGLLRFEAEHRALFFGRVAEIRTLAERLRSEPMVVVAGDSGVGKSSLCRAGVLPAALDDGLGDGRSWTAIRLVPGRHPMAALRAALDLPADEVADSTRVLGAAAPASSAEQLARRVAARDRGRGRVILIDQLEELVTIAAPDEAAEAAGFLAHLGSGLPGVRVLATARCDFLTRLSGLPGLGAALDRALYLLRPMAEDALREAILGPARATGIDFESPALIDELIAGASAADGGLPLLQFTLSELWDARDRDRRAITREAVQRIGGLRGALARHADGVIAQMLPAQRVHARAVLMRLVTAQGTRVRRSDDELTRGDPAARAALDALVRGRLLSAHQSDVLPAADARANRQRDVPAADARDGMRDVPAADARDGMRDVPAADARDDSVYELAHEALLIGWSTLRDWLDERADERVARDRLERAAAEWSRLGKSRDSLWRDRQLAEVAIVPDAELGPAERAFVAASRRERRRRRWRVRIGVAAVVLAAFAGYLAFELVDRRDRARRVAAEVAVGQRALDTARREDAAVESLRAQAFAAFDRGDRDAGEAAWARALAGTDEAAARLREASRAFEAAVTVDNHASRARTLLADTLYARALMAERDRRTAERDEALERLRLYDDGHRLAAWRAPAAVTLTTSPSGAAVRLGRVEDHGGRFDLVDWRDLGTTPLDSLTLAPGSYVFELSLADHAPTRYPLLLARAEHLTADVALLPAAKVPPGMLYIPGGRTLVGTDAPEIQRKAYLRAAPLHPIDIHGFLAARDEATLGEWEQYLRALSPQLRDAALPRAGGAGMNGMIALELLSDGRFRLRLKPTTEAYDVVLGEPLVYRHRSSEITNDSRQLPVTAISPGDAEQYTAWLRSNEQLPGARLCSELEWERLARGADGRAFPSGSLLGNTDANIGEDGSDLASYGPDAIGSHPASRSLFGADDLAGNVWEFTRATYGATTYMARGGAYPLDQGAAMSGVRETVDAKTRDISAGFRVCADVAW